MQNTRTSTLYSNCVIWLALFVSSSAFLLSSECPAPSPCTCSGSSGSQLTINCESKRLTAVPIFGVFDTSVNDLYINLQSNSITSIPNYAFRNLNSIKANNIALYASNNYQINTIENNAFVGVENITSLHLRYNRMTTIPFAISTLKKLQILDFSENPLKSLDHSILSIIGHSLISFTFDINLFTEWPGELRYLIKLQTLSVNNIHFPYLDAFAFHGLENTLTSLSMNSARLQKFPHAVCQLNRLTSLAIRFDSYLNGNKSSIFEPCGHTMQTVTTLNFYYNNIHIFPDDVFSIFPSLTTLEAAYNKFEFIDGSKIPSVSHLTSISLYDNLFERIPSAFYWFRSLEIIDLRDNKIKTVELFDLSTLSKLKYLYLSGNPLVYITPGAFSPNLEMIYLDLDNTKLDYISQDVAHLHNLKTLLLSGRPIDCTCDMSYLKNWNVADVTNFSTKCASSNETIKTFVTMSLQSCP